MGSDGSSFDENEYEAQRQDPTLVVNAEDFNNMKENLESNINMKVNGLDNSMLKKILLTYYRGLYLDDTNLLMELTSEDFYIELEDGTTSEDWTKHLYAVIFNKCSSYERSYSCTIDKAFNIVTEEENDDIKILLKLTSKQYPYDIEYTFQKSDFMIDTEDKWKEYKKKVKDLLDFDPFHLVLGDEDESQGEDLKIYMQEKGMLQIYVACDNCSENGDNTDCTECEKLIYYPLENLKQIYNKHYMEWRDEDKNPKYAEEALEYLQKCYTYDKGGIQMYSKKTKITPTGGLKTWEYEDEGNARRITEKTQVTVELQNIQFYSLVSEYTTPVEFMVNLIEISSSKDFVNNFIERTRENNYVKMKLYSIGYVNQTEETEEKQVTSTVTAKATSYKTDITKTEKLKYVQVGTTPVYDEDGNKIYDEAGNKITKPVYGWRWRTVSTSNARPSADINYDNETATVIAPNGSDYRHTINLINKYNNESVGSKLVYGGSTGTWNLDEDNISDAGKVTIITDVLKSEEKYEIAITDVKTWYANIKQSNNKVNTTILLEYLDKYNNWHTIYNGPVNILTMFEEIAHFIQQQESTGNTVWVTHPNEATEVFEKDSYPTIFNISNKNGIQNSYDEYKKYSRDENYNILFNWALYAEDNNKFKNHHEIMKRLTVTNTARKKQTLKLTIEATFTEGIKTYEDNSDLFLGLLSNKIGKYKSKEEYATDALFKEEQFFLPEASNGKLVKYDDLYNGETRVGKLLENGSEMMFELLESSPNTQGLVDIMKYIIYRYTGNDYGVTSLNVSIFPLQKVEFSDLTEEEIATSNEDQLAIVEVAKNSGNYGIGTESGYCLAWVNDVYEAAGINVTRKCCAYCSGYLFGVSDDFSNVPIGAAVYGESSTVAGRKYGHVGIYVGDGKVADNIGYVRVSRLDEWIQKYPNGCWGWTSSRPVNATYGNTTHGLIHAGLHE